MLRKQAYRQSGSRALPTSSPSFESQAGQRYSCPKGKITTNIICTENKTHLPKGKKEVGTKVNSFTAEQSHHLIHARGVRPCHNGRPAAGSHLGSDQALPDIRGRAHPPGGASTGASLYVNADIYIYMEQTGMGTDSSLRSVCRKQLPGRHPGSRHSPVPDSPVPEKRRRNGAWAGALGAHIPPAVPGPPTRPLHEESERVTTLGEPR